MKKIIILVPILILIINCAGGGKYYSLSSIDESSISSAHYQYKDENLLFAAKIRSGGILGVFWHDFLIINNGNVPLQLHGVYDVLNMSLGGKIYQLSKFSSYPTVLNPDDSFNVGFGIDGKFNDKINDIEELIFQFRDTKYILKKNLLAKWE